MTYTLRSGFVSGLDVSGRGVSATGEDNPAATPHCCEIGCDKEAKFWVGKDNIDQYTHACGDHVDDLKEDGDAVIPL